LPAAATDDVAGHAFHHFATRISALDHLLMQFVDAAAGDVVARLFLTCSMSMAKDFETSFW